MKKTYMVILTTTTVQSVYVEAESNEQAIEVSQMDHVSWGKEVIDSTDYLAAKAKKPEREWLYNKDGYIDSEGDQIELV